MLVSTRLKSLVDLFGNAGSPDPTSNIPYEAGVSVCKRANEERKCGGSRSAEKRKVHTSPPRVEEEVPQERKAFAMNRSFRHTTGWARV